MEAVILAGGKGTRLKPFTATLPKPLVPVGDRPVIEILLHQFRRAGIDRVHLAVNHLAGLIKGVVGDGKQYGLDVVYSIEDSPLSTVGPIKRIHGLPDQFLVANGDVLTDLDLTVLLSSHAESSAELTVAAHRRKEQLDYGILTVTKSPSSQFSFRWASMCLIVQYWNWFRTIHRLGLTT
jgi:NDP-sugar pyrophosphorylase family protein